MISEKQLEMYGGTLRGTMLGVIFNWEGGE